MTYAYNGKDQCFKSDATRSHFLCVFDLIQKNK